MTGTVLVSVTYAPSGQVVSVTLLRSCGHPALDEHTCKSIRENWIVETGQRFTEPPQPVTYQLR